MSKLGDFFFEQACKYPDASNESFVCMDICVACDDFDDDIPKVIEYLEERLEGCRKISSNPERSKAMREHWSKKVALLGQGIKELYTQDKKISSYLTWNTVSKRYEGEFDGKKLCVDEKSFALAYEAATNDPDLCPQDDEQRVWGVITWFSSWLDKDNKPINGAYFE